MYAFLSYQTKDRAVAAEVRSLLNRIGIATFMAHEDIQVSHEWRNSLLNELGSADLFVALLSGGYFSSTWCVQEAGIAAFRKIGIIPLSLDGTVPEGFVAHIQSVRVAAGSISLQQILPAVAGRNAAFVIDLLIDQLGRSGSYRGAEENFQAVLPYLAKATDGQIVNLLTVSAANDQVLHAALCCQKYLPPLVESHRDLLSPETLLKIETVFAQYARR